MNIVSENKMVIDRTLGYPVKDIMTPESELTCWTGEEHDRLTVLHTAHLYGFTYVPVSQTEGSTVLCVQARYRGNANQIH